MTFTQSIKLILKTYKELETESNVKSAQNFEPDKPGKVKPGSTPPPDYPSELRAMEESLARIARAFAERRRFLSYLEEYYAMYGEDAPCPDPPQAHSERTEAVLAEVGRTPIEVAALYGYRYPSSVEQLRKRHRCDPKTGEPLEKPLTADYRVVNSARDAKTQHILNEVGKTPAEVAELYGYKQPHSVEELRERHGRDRKTGERA